MKIVIFGLSITSAWGNGHATTFRALSRALHARGHRIVFFEKNLEWYASNRDLPDPAFCEMRIFEQWRAVLPQVRRELSGCDVALVGSYVPDGISAIREVLESTAAVKAFYDIDTPVTVAQLRETGTTDYLQGDQIPGFDLYFSFTGGPMLRELEERFGARRALPLYCSVDASEYRPWPVHKRYESDMSYMGTYAPDRQPKIEELLCTPARRLPGQKFLLAGPQYPRNLRWPANVRRIRHLNPRWHARFYSSSRLTLNVTRRAMVKAGYSPSVRLFEAAACGATMVSDNWPGLDSLFVPGKEILIPSGPDDVVRYLQDPAELRSIGQRAQERVLAEHTAERRAEQFEQYVNQATAASALGTVDSSEQAAARV
ncbi:MAG TPA: glycosyltransferase [Terriglobales bacterium]|nr:glycosyltransferase [Terriglobales bacterium]